MTENADQIIGDYFRKHDSLIVAQPINDIFRISTEKTSQITATKENKFGQNYPNPFSDNTAVSYSINSNAASTHIIIRNLNGVEVKRIVLEKTIP